MEKSEKQRYCDIFSTGYDDWGYDKYLVEALWLTSTFFNFLGMQFWLDQIHVFAVCITEKTTLQCGPFQSPPNQKSLCWYYETWSALVPDTYKQMEKIQVPATFHDNAILIFVLISFCKANCTVAVKSEKVWYIESSRKATITDSKLSR
jgi:hypothetical protein